MLNLWKNAMRRLANQAQAPATRRRKRSSFTQSAQPLETRALLSAVMLEGGGPETGEADYEVEDSETEFEVEVENASPGAVLPVSVDGVQVGEITVDADGEGELEYSSETDEGAPFPANFPVIAEGSVVTVGSILSGTITNIGGDDDDEDDEDELDDDTDDVDDDADDTDDDDATGMANGASGTANATQAASSSASAAQVAVSATDANEVELEADLAGAGSETGEASYETDGTAMEFEVELEGAAPGSVHTVTVDGIDVGEITADDNGEGELSYSSDPDDNADFPANFPAIAEGSTVDVGGMVSGSLAMEVEDETDDDEEELDDVEDDDEDDATDDDAADGDATATGGTTGAASANQASSSSASGAQAAASTTDANETELEAELIGAGSETGEASYETDGTSTEFEVEIEGATPGSVHAVTIDGVEVGTITVDEDGEGELSFSSDAVDNSPFPADFPALVEGANVDVGGLVSGLITLEVEDETDEDDDEMDDDSDEVDDDATDAEDDDDDDDVAVGTGTDTAARQQALDLDGSGDFNFANDGIILLAYSFGSRGEALEAFRGIGDTRTGAEIEAYIDSLGTALDVDGDGEFSMASDGIILLAYSLGSKGNQLDGLAGDGATRTGDDITKYVEGLESGDIIATTTSANGDIVIIVIDPTASTDSSSSPTSPDITPVADQQSADGGSTDQSTVDGSASIDGGNASSSGDSNNIDAVFTASDLGNALTAV